MDPNPSTNRNYNYQPPLVAKIPERRLPTPYTNFASDEPRNLSDLSPYYGSNGHHSSQSPLNSSYASHNHLRSNFNVASPSWNYTRSIPNKYDHRSSPTIQTSPHAPNRVSPHSIVSSNHLPAPKEPELPRTYHNIATKTPSPTSLRLSTPSLYSGFSDPSYQGFSNHYGYNQEDTNPIQRIHQQIDKTKELLSQNESILSTTPTKPPASAPFAEKESPPTLTSTIELKYLRLIQELLFLVTKYSSRASDNGELTSLIGDIMDLVQRHTADPLDKNSKSRVATMEEVRERNDGIIKFYQKKIEVLTSKLQSIEDTQDQDAKEQPVPPKNITRKSSLRPPSVQSEGTDSERKTLQRGISFGVDVKREDAADDKKDPVEYLARQKSLLDFFLQSGEGKAESPSKTDSTNSLSKIDSKNEKGWWLKEATDVEPWEYKNEQSVVPTQQSNAHPPEQKAKQQGSDTPTKADKKSKSSKKSSKSSVPDPSDQEIEELFQDLAPNFSKKKKKEKKVTE